MQADRHGGGLIHRVDVQLVIDVEHAAAKTRIDFAPPVGDAIHISTFQCREPRVETLRRRADGMDGDVVRHNTLQPMFQCRHCRHPHMPFRAAQRACVDVDVAYLMAGVHSSVGASSHHQANRIFRVIRWHAQYPSYRVLDFPLHGANVRLEGPSIKSPTVIAQVDSQSHNPHTTAGATTVGDAPPPAIISLMKLRTLTTA